MSARDDSDVGSGPATLEPVGAVGAARGFDLGGDGPRLLEFGDRVPLAILGLDDRGTVNYANPALAALTGRPSGEIEGTDGLGLLFGAAEHEPDDRYSRLLAGDAPAYFETEVLGTSARPRTIGWHTVPIHSGHGSLVGSLSVGADLTSRLRAAAAREALESIERSILRGRPVAELEGLACEAARDVTDAAYVVLARPGPLGCEVRAVLGLPADELGGQPVSAPWCNSSSADPSPVVSVGAESLGDLAGDLGPTVMVPLAAPPSCGFLLVADPVGTPRFDGDVVEALAVFARQVNVALEYGSRLRELAVLEDRERIARDLHDLVIQRIFAAGLSLQVAAQMVDDRPEVAGRLSEVSVVLDGAIAELRRSILGLQEPEERMLGRRVEQVVVEVTDEADLDVVVEAPGGAVGVSETLIGHLLAVLREALTNVVRHAFAGKVEVVVEVDDSLVLSVRDDGVGMSGAGGEGMGLANLSDRARQLGGDLHVGAAPGGGVSLEWRVPLLPLRPD